MSLNGFAGRFIDITEMARALPRDSVVREMANKVVAGAETEEEAIRHLRDNWQSEDSGGYDNVDVKRSAASALQKEVEDALSDLRDKTAPPSRASVNAFSAAFQQLNAQWDEFRLSYDAFRAEEPKLTSPETLGRLSQLVDELRAIVVAVRQLPTSEATRHVAETLSEAAEEEDLALRKLRGTVPGSQEGEALEPQPGEGETQPAAGLPEQSSEGAGSSGEEGAKFVPRDAALFDDFDAQLVRSNTIRRRARVDLADITDAVSVESQDIVEGFAREYGQLLRAWNGFHEEYDGWRQTEGGCDRSLAVEALARLALRFGKLTSDVRVLPGAPFLRPLGELLVEAAEREETALRDLRNAWRPFDSEIWTGSVTRPEGLDDRWPPGCRTCWRGTVSPARSSRREPPEVGSGLRRGVPRHLHGGLRLHEDPVHSLHTHLDAVPVAQPVRVLPQLFAVDVGAVAAVQVLDPEAVGVPPNRGVLSGYTRLVHNNIIGGASAYHRHPVGQQNGVPVPGASFYQQGRPWCHGLALPAPVPCRLEDGAVGKCRRVGPPSQQRAGHETDDEGPRDAYGHPLEKLPPGVETRSLCAPAHSILSL